MRPLVPAALFLVLATGCWPEPEAAPAARDEPPAPAAPDAASTVEYWNSLHRAHRRIGEVAELLDDARTPGGVAAAMKDASAGLRDAAKELVGLPVRGVDPAAVKYGAGAAENLQDAAALFADFADFLAEVNRFADRSKSFGAGAGAFASGFLEVPLGPFDGLNLRVREFDTRRRALLDRFTALREKSARLDALEVTTRSGLSARYDREFPSLGGLRGSGRTPPAPRPGG